jgi:hypothetical protein
MVFQIDNDNNIKRFSYDCGDTKKAMLRVDGVIFNITSRFNGHDRLSDLLLAVVKADNNKNPLNTDVQGSKGGDICYNQIGS